MMSKMVCPECGSDRIYTLLIDPPVYQCLKCKNIWRDGLVDAMIDMMEAKK